MIKSMLCGKPGGPSFALRGWHTFLKRHAVAANVLFDDSRTLSRIIEKPTTTLELAVTEALCAARRESE